MALFVHIYVDSLFVMFVVICRRSFCRLSVSHGLHEACRRRRGGCLEREAESGRLLHMHVHTSARRIEAQSVGLMDARLRTEAESRGLRARG